MFLFLCCPLFLNVFCFRKVITHSFFSFFLLFPHLFFLINIKATTLLIFFLLLSSFFKCSFCSSPKLSCIAFFIYSYFLNCSFKSSSRLSYCFFWFFLLSSCFKCSFFFINDVNAHQLFLFLWFFSELRLANFDFLFKGDFNLLGLGFSSSRVIVNFAFCFCNSWRTDGRIIVSSGAKSTSAVPFNEFGRAVRKLVIFS